MAAWMCGCLHVKARWCDTVKTDMKTNTHTHSLGTGAHTHQPNDVRCPFVIVVMSEGLRLVGCCGKGRRLCDLQGFQDRDGKGDDVGADLP